MKIFDEVEIAASASALSSAIRLANAKGFFSLQMEITGDGTVKVEYLPSNNKTDFVASENGSEIATALTKTSGTGGKVFFSFQVDVAKEIKLKITETGGANGNTISAWLN